MSGKPMCACCQPWWNQRVTDTFCQAFPAQQLSRVTGLA